MHLLGIFIILVCLCRQHFYLPVGKLLEPDWLETCCWGRELLDFSLNSLRNHCIYTVGIFKVQFKISNGNENLIKPNNGRNHCRSLPWDVASSLRNNNSTH